MSTRGKTLVARLACGVGVALAVAAGVLLHSAFSHTFGTPLLVLSLTVLLLAAVALIVFAAARERAEAARRQTELLAEVRAQAEHLREANDRLTRQTAEIARQRDEARLLESAVVHARDGVVVLEAAPTAGPGRRVLYVNAAFCRLTGYAPDEVVGRSLHVLRGPDSCPNTLTRIRQALEAGTPHQAELQNYRKDGTGFWVELSLVPVPDPAGRVAHWVMIQRDVTDRKRAEDALRAGEERLRLIGDNVPDGAIYQAVIRPDHTPLFTHLSTGVEKLYGLTARQVMDDPGVLDRLLYPDDLPRLREAQLFSHRDLAPLDIEFRTFTTDGRLKWVHCRAMSRRLPDGVIERNGIILDVTDRKRAEEALRASEQLFRGIFESTSAGISLTDPAGRFVSCNPAYAAIVGRTVAEVHRLTPADFTHPDDWAAQLPLIEEVQAGTRDRFDHTKRYFRPDGETVWTELSFAAIRGPDGRYEYGLGVTIDVTARRRLEEQLREARQLEATGRLAGGVAHDFNNLLTGVLGNLALVQLPPDDANRPLVAAAEQAAGRAAELTRRLLGYARGNQLVPGPVPPHEALAAVATALDRGLDPRVRVEIVVSPGCGPVLADAALLHNALINLCVNARDAMPDGGTLTLSAEPVEVAPRVEGEGASHHPDARAGEFIRLRVADTGRGMTAAEQARIFDPFFTTKGPDAGIGLGLPMVQGIAKQHRGWVECTSVPGDGTQIDLYLPPAAEGMPAAAVRYSGVASPSSTTPYPTPRPEPRDIPAERPALGPPADVTILLVDDEEMIRTLGRMILERAGYRVVTADDGADAVEVFARERDRIGLVILDVTMPRMSGREAYRHMTDLSPAVRILFSTGYSAEDIAELDGALGLLSKPYRPHELLAAVRDALTADPVDRA